MISNAARLNRRRLLVGGLALAGLGVSVGCGGSKLPWPFAAKLHVVGYLAGAPPNPTGDGFQAAFMRGMRDLGYVEGETFSFEVRRGLNDQYDGPIAELLALQPAAILVPAANEARAVHAKTSTVPIVSSGVGDLAAAGLAASPARPGGNVTGFSTPLLADKQLEYLKAAIPTLTRIAVLVASERPGDFSVKDHQNVLDELGLDMRVLPVTGPNGPVEFFEAAVREGCDGVYLSPVPLVTNNQARIAALALQYRLPAIAQQSDATRLGQLMRYGPNREDLYRRAATFVDKIVMGAKPGDIPIESPTLYESGINVKTAQALGLTIEQNVIAQATEVIQEGQDHE